MIVIWLMSIRFQCHERIIYLGIPSHCYRSLNKIFKGTYLLFFISRLNDKNFCLFFRLKILNKYDKYTYILNIVVVYHVFLHSRFLFFFNIIYVCTYSIYDSFSVKINAGYCRYLRYLNFDKRDIHTCL